MIFEERTFDINGKDLVLRAPREEDAEMLRHYIKKACGETRFLMAEGDEMDLSLEDELEFINSHRDSDSGMLIRQQKICASCKCGYRSFTKVYQSGHRQNHVWCNARRD